MVIPAVRWGVWAGESILLSTLTSWFEPNTLRDVRRLRRRGEVAGPLREPELSGRLSQGYRSQQSSGKRPSLAAIVQFSGSRAT